MRRRRPDGPRTPLRRILAFASVAGACTTGPSPAPDADSLRALADVRHHLVPLDDGSSQVGRDVGDTLVGIDPVGFVRFLVVAGHATELTLEFDGAIELQATLRAEDSREAQPSDKLGPR